MHIRSIFLRFFRGLYLALGVFAVSGAAEAQLGGNTLPTPSGTTFEKISLNQVLGLLAELGIQAQRNQSSPTSGVNILAQAPNGGRFYVDLISCEDDQALIGCRSMRLRAGMANTGVSYDDLNSFHGSSAVATAINLPEQNLILFYRLAIVAGGVGKEQLQIQTSLFLNDMDQYVQTQASATSVSYKEDNPSPIDFNKKIAPLSAVPQTSLPAAALVDGDVLDSAIHNTYSVRFMTPEAQSFLK